MRYQTRRFPFIALGTALWAVSAIPTFIGMSRAMNAADDVDRTNTINRWLAVSFHPFFRTCALLAILCITMGVVRWLYGFRGKREHAK